MNGVSSNYLLDTNIFIYYFNGDPVVQPFFTEIATDHAIGLYCPISWPELLCYPNLSKAEANQIRAFLRTFTCIALTEPVLDRTAQIRRNYRVRLPNALIAACAIETNSILVTRNIADFQRISGINVLNPFNL